MDPTLKMPRPEESRPMKSPRKVRFDQAHVPIPKPFHPASGKDNAGPR